MPSLASHLATSSTSPARQPTPLHADLVSQSATLSAGLASQLTPLSPVPSGLSATSSAGPSGLSATSSAGPSGLSATSSAGPSGLSATSSAGLARLSSTSSAGLAGLSATPPADPDGRPRRRRGKDGDGRRSGRRLLWAVCAALGFLAVCGIPLPTASADEGGPTEWSVAPADSNGPDGRISLRHELEPGASVKDAIAVTNLSEAPVEFVVETGAGQVGEQGAFDIDESNVTGVGGWIAVAGLTDGKVVLEAGEARVLSLTITAPEDATPGDHPAGVTVGVSQGEDVTVTHRVGVRLHLRVAGDIRPELRLTVSEARFSPSWLPFAPGELLVDYRIENVGNVRLGADVAVEAAGPLGLGATKTGLDPVEELLPGESVERSAEIEAPTLFWLRATLTATPTVVGADEAPPAAAASAATSLPAVSATGVALLAALAVGAAVPIIRRRPRSSPQA